MKRKQIDELKDLASKRSLSTDTEITDINCLSIAASSVSKSSIDITEKASKTPFTQKSTQRSTQKSSKKAVAADIELGSSDNDDEPAQSSNEENEMDIQQTKEKAKSINHVFTLNPVTKKYLCLAGCKNKEFFLRLLHI